MLAGTLKGIISQRLVPRADGNGRIAIAEILTMTGRVHDLILDRERTGELPDVIAEGELLRHADLRPGALQGRPRGRSSPMQDAIHYATRPHDLKLLLDAEGHLHTTMEDIERRQDEESAAKRPAPARRPPSAPGAVVV